MCGPCRQAANRVPETGEVDCPRAQELALPRRIVVKTNVWRNRRATGIMLLKPPFNLGKRKRMEESLGALGIIMRAQRRLPRSVAPSQTKTASDT